MPPSRRPPPPPPPPASKAIWWLVAALVAVPALVLALVLWVLPSDRPKSSSTAAADAPGASSPTAAPTGKVRGRVTTEDGEPALGVKVALLGPPPAYARLREADADGSGRFSFAETGGATRVRVLAERDGGLVVSAELVVDAEPVADLVLALEPARNIRGKATFDNGSPAAGVVVEIVDAPAWARRRTTTEDNGTYSLPIVGTKARALRATAKGAAMLSVALLGTEPDEIVDLKLQRENEIDGTVVDTDGKPVRRAEVVACDGREEGSKVLTDNEGRFQIARRFSSCPLVATHDAHGASDPVPAGGERPVLKLKAGGAIQGTVVDDKGRPAAEFFVGVESFAPAGGAPSVRSGAIKSFKDPAGAFSIDKLAPGTYVLSYGAEGHAAQRSAQIELRPGETRRDVKLSLFAGGAVEGTVTDGDGKPLADVTVAFDVVSSTRRGDGSAKTGADGKYRLDGAPPERFSIRFDKPGYRSRVLSGITVDARGSVTRDASLSLLEDGGPSSEVAGIGAVLEQTRGGVSLAAVYPGAPAEKAGFQRGDVLVSVDGKSARGMSVADLTQALRGDPGTKVHLSVTRPGGSLEVTVERAVILR